MLLGHIETLGEVPSRQVGAFYGKAMAISDVAERIRFLNRGQGWVVRTLRQMLPRVRNDGLHADLCEMLRLQGRIEDPSEAKLATLERNGQISAIPRHP